VELLLPPGSLRLFLTGKECPNEGIVKFGTVGLKIQRFKAQLRQKITPVLISGDEPLEKS
jgi:hypothetical protein